MRRYLLLALAFGLIVAVRYFEDGSTSTPTERGPSGVTDTRAPADDAILRAFEAQRSDVWVEAWGEVSRTLPDDNEGSRHQKFIVRLPSGHTILLSHNIDLAPRIPLSQGDRVDFRGEYEYTARGGVVHWTHHDPRGRKEGGWVRHEGEIYK